MKALKIAIIGAGLMAHGHALSLRSIIDGVFRDNNISLGAVYDVDRKKAEIFADQHDVEKIVDNPSEIWEDPSLNVVYICTPTFHHKEYFLDAAAAGKHIFIEKPLAFSVNDIDEMILARNRAGIQAQVGLVLRFEPLFWYIKQLVADNFNRFGKLLGFVFRSDQEWPLPGSKHDSDWRGNPEMARAGCLFEHSIHDMDLVRYFFGDVENIEAYTACRSNSGGGVLEDFAAVNFRLENGGTGNLTSMYHHIKDRDVRRFEIFFERASIIVDDYVVVSIGRPRYRSFTIEVSGEKPLEVSMDEIDRGYLNYINWPGSVSGAGYFAYQFQAFSFLRALLEGQEVSPGLETARIAHHLLEKVYEKSVVGSRRPEGSHSTKL